MITGNLTFSKREQIFKNPMVTAAAVDRIESCRMEAAMKNKSKKLMTRQRSLNRLILGNGNLWTGHRSSLVGHLRRPLFQQIKDRRRKMHQTGYNPHNDGPETINIDFTHENTTWFDDTKI